MIRYCSYFLLTFIIISCARRTIEGRVRPVYFSAKDVVFTDSFFPVQTISYKNTLGLGTPCLEGVDLFKGKESVAFIPRPTIFRKQQYSFLVYPGDKIEITTNDSINYEPTFLTKKHDPVRDKELSVLKTFQQFEFWPRIVRLPEFNYETILSLEHDMRSSVFSTEQSAQKVFDSLCAVNKVRRKFRKNTKDYIRHRYDLAVLNLYDVYKDTLLARHQYWGKIRALLPQVNDITGIGEFTENVESNTNMLYTSLFPTSGIRNMVVNGSFDECFDSIAANFNGPARDFLLSRVMYRAYQQHSPISKDYYASYRKYSMNKTYRKLVKRMGKLYRKPIPEEPTAPNELLMADGETKTAYDSVIADQKGRYILVDLWASWCAPCLEEMPALRELRKAFSSEQLAVISVSVDASVSAWRSRLFQLKSDSLTNFLLLKKDNAELTQRVKLNTIPRYLLYDKSGTLINEDAPSPSDPELVKLLSTLLH